jgi:hypothetical protein
MRKIALPLVGLVLLACSPESAEVRPDRAVRAQATPPPPRPIARFDARSAAVDSYTARECESRAREQRKVSAAEGWEVLSACLDQHKFARDEFTDWALLLPAWRKELSTHQEAPALLARFIAQRGGDVEADLVVLRENDLPYKTLADVADDEKAAAGTTLILRGRFTNDDEAPEGKLLFVETILRGVKDTSSRPSYTYGGAAEKSKNVAFYTRRIALVPARGSVAFAKEKDYVVVARVEKPSRNRKPLQLTVLSVYTPSPVLVD